MLRLGRALCLGASSPFFPKASLQDLGLVTLSLARGLTAGSWVSETGQQGTSVLGEEKTHRLRGHVEPRLVQVSCFAY